MYNNIYYEAFFFDEDSKNLIYSKDTMALLNRYSDLHITFKFNPEKEDLVDSIVGKEYQFKVIGYGNDGQNSGFEIEIPEELRPFYKNYEADGTPKIPHITVSLAEGAKAVNTKNLDFKPLEQPFYVNAVFGYCYKVDDVKTVSFEPADSTKKIK